MRIYLVRHGETLWNLEGKMQGWKDSPLSERGIQNAKKLGERLQEIPFDLILCSPLGRTVATAEYIKGERDIPMKLVDGLKEMSFGLWEGMERSALEAQYPEALENFFRSPHLYRPVEGESFEDVFHRVERTLMDLLHHSQGEHILVVTHTVVIKAIYAILKNLPLSELWNLPYIYDTSLTIIEFDGGKVNFILEADGTHREMA